MYLDAVNRLPSHYAPQSLYNMLGMCVPLSCLLATRVVVVVVVIIFVY